MILGVNYIRPFLLTVVTSISYEIGNFDFDYTSTHNGLSLVRSFLDLGMVYSQSKLCNVPFTQGLANSLEGTNVTCCSVRPGLGTTCSTSVCPTIILKS